MALRGTNSGAPGFYTPTKDVPKLSNTEAGFAMEFFNEPPNMEITVITGASRMPSGHALAS